MSQLAWSGYWAYSGSEIINAERTETYLRSAGVSWFNAVFKTTAISTLENETYQSAITDEPPWADPDNADTYRFYGVFPLNIVGTEDSTRTAAITENVYDGGVVGTLRHGTKAIVFECALFGADECGVEAGFAWLKQALLEGPCDDGCSGEDLCYFNCEPCIPEDCGDDAEGRQECLDRYMRTLRGVKFTTGPSITAKRNLSDGSVMWTVTFTAVAGTPFEFGSEIPLVEGFMVEDNPWVPDILPADWAFDDVGALFNDVDCSVPFYNPVIDPECPAVEVPPHPPSIALGCIDLPEQWRRRWFSIPRRYVPYWGNITPIIRIQAGNTAVRNLRLRFYADVEGNASVLEDPCAFCGDILFSYIPEDHTLVFDGASQIVSAEGPGGTNRRADSVVFKTDGTPFDWPVLSCGFGYLVTVDLPLDATGELPAIDLSLIPRSA